MRVLLQSLAITLILQESLKLGYEFGRIISLIIHGVQDVDWVIPRINCNFVVVDERLSEDRQVREHRVGVKTHLFVVHLAFLIK